MDKVLGQEIAGKLERKQYLQDNCDAVEDLGYVKPIPSDELDELKDRLVENNIQLLDVRADKKEANRELDDQIKQLEKSNGKVTKMLKERSVFVTEPCYKLVDHETREAGYYNSEGVLVYSRPIRPEESQKTFNQVFRTTGTEQ